MKRLAMRNGEVVDALRECPECGRGLARHADGYVCHACNERYPEVPE